MGLQFMFILHLTSTGRVQVMNPEWSPYAWEGCLWPPPDRQLQGVRVEALSIGAMDRQGSQISSSGSRVSNPRFGRMVAPRGFSRRAYVDTSETAMCSVTAFFTRCYQAVLAAGMGHALLLPSRCLTRVRIAGVARRSTCRVRHSEMHLLRTVRKLPRD